MLLPALLRMRLTPDLSAGAGCRRPWLTCRTASPNVWEVSGMAESTRPKRVVIVDAENPLQKIPRRILLA